jgi:endonuclease III
MAKPRRAPRPSSAPSAQEVASLLEARYGKYTDESAGPVLDQLAWFLLSTRTTVENCEAAYAALRDRFPSWEAVAEAPPEYIGDCIRPAGLYRTRAANLQGALAAVRGRLGAESLEALRGWPDGECESFLLSLPGVGLKVARCVMAFGLGRRAFAVDAHIWRITRRLGWHAFAGAAPSGPGSDAVQEIARGAADTLSLHVNLIRLGRERCPAGEPRCAGCPLEAPCPRLVE